jgi:hypothetical protein
VRIALGALFGLTLAGAAMSAKPLAIDEVAGVYKHRFQNGDTGGGKYESEDILEIVKVSERTAYVRLHLEFFNGHQCGISGVAEVSGAALVYKSKAQFDEYNGKRCVLTITPQGGAVTVSDAYSCKSHCGARGAIEGTAFKLSAKRPIRYMTRVKNSSEYAEAMREHRESH